MGCSICRPPRPETPLGDSSSTLMMDVDLQTMGCSSSGFGASTSQEMKPKKPPEQLCGGGLLGAARLSTGFESAPESRLRLARVSSVTASWSGSCSFGALFWM